MSAFSGQSSSFSGQPSSADTGGSSGSSSWTHLVADAELAAPVRAERAAQAFVRAMDVHITAALTPNVTGALQPAGVISAGSTMVPDDLSSQIVQAVRMQWSDGAGEARITLRPEYLGEVSISLHVDQGNVTAVLHADSPAVRNWLQQNEPLLSQALSEHGLKLERLVVSEQPPAEHGGAPQDEARGRQEQPRRRRQRPDAPNFEIIL